MAGSPSVLRFVLGLFDTNCYVAADPISRNALIIDPAEPSRRVVNAIRSDGLFVVGIVNTHGHADHIAGNAVMKDEFCCPIMIHESDATFLTDPHRNLSAETGFGHVQSPPADRVLLDGERIKLGALSLRVIHTPGHTPGGVSLLAGGVLFSGDTLFAGGIGRTDFPGGSPEQLLESIRRRLLVLGDDIALYPGHGPESTLGEERRNNPYIREAVRQW